MLGCAACTHGAAAPSAPAQEPVAAVAPLPGNTAAGGEAGWSACGQLDAGPSTTSTGLRGTVFRWYDARCLPRSAELVANDAPTPDGKWGGYMARYSYQVGNTLRTCVGEHPVHPGFGLVVSHWDKTATVSNDIPGTTSTVLLGAHHAIHRYVWKAMPIHGHPVDVTVDWTFAAGRDHPLWAITYDLSKVPADAVRADTRAPYGDIAWDGGGGHPVSGVGWGDRFQFRSLGAPFSLASGWDYTRPNLVPYAMAWTDAPDAELGIIQSQTFAQHDAGGYWSYARWRQRDDDGPMPEDWNWTFQINQYELPFTNASKRMGWGANYGAVGQRAYPAYGDDKQLVGWPYQSYAVYIAFGTHTGNTTAEVVADMERVQHVRLSASVGRVASEGPAGAGRADLAAYDPPGWDPVHGAFTIVAESGRAVVSWQVPERLRRPLLHVHGLGATRVELALGGAPPLVDGVDYFSSFDPRDGSSWITLARDLSGEQHMELTAR
jgi:hypothetical protein